jgi:hypothetical protein
MGVSSGPIQIERRSLDRSLDTARLVSNGYSLRANLAKGVILVSAIG